MGDLTLRAFAYLRLPLALAALGLLIVAAGTWKFPGRRAVPALVLMMVLFFHAARLALVTFDPYLGSRPLAEALNRSPEGRLIVDDQYYAFSSVMFYANRRALLLNGRINNIEYGSYAPGAPDVFLDDQQFWPIFERAEKLDVPIYLHPSIPHPAVTEAYYKDYIQDFPMVIRAAWGFTVETATQVIRLVLSGVFGRYPNLKIIVGHLGETLPFLLWRIDQALSRPGPKQISFRDVFSSHVYLTTSGNFSNPALLCCVQELGIDRIMFAVDWPFVANPLGTQWVDTIPLCEEDKIKILSGNAKRLLRM